jgi:hypothetical protein
MLKCSVNTVGSMPRRYKDECVWGGGGVYNTQTALGGDEGVSSCLGPFLLIIRTPLT